jgi:hypothetical protein
MRGRLRTRLAIRYAAIGRREQAAMQIALGARPRHC